VNVIDGRTSARGERQSIANRQMLARAHLFSSPTERELATKFNRGSLKMGRLIAVLGTVLRHSYGLNRSDESRKTDSDWHRFSKSKPTVHRLERLRLGYLPVTLRPLILNGPIAY
jgi:hypothetical protein